MNDLSLAMPTDCCLFLISPLRLPPSSRKTSEWVATIWSNSQSVRLSSRISPVVEIVALSPPYLPPANQSEAH
jgi:hypothetical protein